MARPRSASFLIVREEIGDNKDFRGTLGNFNQIDRVAKEYNGAEFNGVLFDLGLSSFQLLTEGRGFSFKKTGLTCVRALRFHTQHVTS